MDYYESDLLELDHLISLTKRTGNICRLKNIRQHLVDEIESQKRAAEAKAKRESGSDQPKRFEFQLTNYAWDQSDKFVKLFITLDSLQNPAEESVSVKFTDRSITLLIAGADGKDYKFEVLNLLYPIDVDNSYRKVKTNAVVIYAKKSSEKKTWSHLTSTEKRLADVKNSTTSELEEDDKSDPTAGLMNIMRKMYDTGDPEMKKMIAKAWTEGQENKMKGSGGFEGM